MCHGISNPSQSCVLMQPPEQKSHREIDDLELILNNTFIGLGH